MYILVLVCKLIQYEGCHRVQTVIHCCALHQLSEFNCARRDSDREEELCRMVCGSFEVAGHPVPVAGSAAGRAQEGTDGREDCRRTRRGSACEASAQRARSSECAPRGRLLVGGRATRPMPLPLPPAPSLEPPRVPDLPPLLARPRNPVPLLIEPLHQRKEERPAERPAAENPDD